MCIKYQYEINTDEFLYTIRTNILKNRMSNVLCIFKIKSFISYKIVKVLDRWSDVSWSFYCRTTVIVNYGTPEVRSTLVQIYVSW